MLSSSLMFIFLFVFQADDHRLAATWSTIHMNSCMYAYVVSMATSDVTDRDAYIGRSTTQIPLRSETALAGRRRTDAGRGRGRPQPA